MIIPAFNASRYIRETLDSVLAQTYPAIEVIVVDDGSSDATSAIVEEFAGRDARIQFIWQSNMGVGAARNAAIRKARGKYIAPLDSDDWWFPEKLERQVACMEQGGAQTGLVYCWCALINERGGFLRLSHPQTAEGCFGHRLVLGNIVGCASSPLFRAAALEKVGLYLTREEQGGAQGCEDWDLAIRIAEAFSLRVVPEYLVAYRQSRSSMSVNIKGMAASYGVLIRRARQRNDDLPPATFRWSAGSFYCYLAQQCYYWGYHRWCLRYITRMVRADPVWLLNTWTYKVSMQALLRLVTRSTVSHFAEQVRPSPYIREAVKSRAQRKRKPRFILNRIFERIILKRWSVAPHGAA